MGRFLAVYALFGLLVGPAFADVPSDPTVAPAPEILIAQIDDSDLRDEETLNELMTIEYSKQAWSMGTAVGLSMLPGAGWGLVYTKQKAQAVIPILLSAIGYGLGGLYVAGIFNEKSEQKCRHVREGFDVSGVPIPLERCGYAGIVYDPSQPDRIDNQDPDDLDPQERPFFATAADYSVVTVGQDFDGTNLGLGLIIGTYVTTTLLGAIWSGTAVAEHNNQLRKDIESTAQAPRTSPSEDGGPRAVVGFDGRSGHFGLALDF